MSKLLRLYDDFISISTKNIISLFGNYKLTDIDFQNITPYLFKFIYKFGNNNNKNIELQLHINISLLKNDIEKEKIINSFLGKNIWFDGKTKLSSDLENALKIFSFLIEEQNKKSYEDKDFGITGIKLLVKDIKNNDIIMQFYND